MSSFLRLNLIGAWSITMCLFFSLPALANNIKVSGPPILAQNTSSHEMTVQFDLQWENSWYDNSTTNHDAAWVFLKYRLSSAVDSSQTWYHASLKVSSSDVNKITNYYGITTGVRNPSGFSRGTCTSMDSSSHTTNPCTNIDIVAPIDYYCDEAASNSLYGKYGNTCVYANATPSNLPFCAATTTFTSLGSVASYDTCGTAAGATYTLGAGSHTIANLTPGAFVQPSGLNVYSGAANTGTFTVSQLQFLWDYNTDIQNNNSALCANQTARDNCAASAQVQILAIEMVKIPTLTSGQYFPLGDGSVSNTSTGAAGNGDVLFKSGFPINIGGTVYTTPYYVGINSDSTESSIDVGHHTTSSGKLTYNGVVDTFTIPAGFPKGAKGFYIMKYELSQGQYKDFLNLLTRYQQIQNIYTAINVADSSEANVYVMANETTVAAPSLTNNKSYRNGIRTPSSFNANQPINFGCDFDGDATTPSANVLSNANETTDGQWIACNYSVWDEVTAYGAWAGLRPMSEFEFERAAGPVASTNTTPSPLTTNKIFAWGTTDVTYFLTANVLNSGLDREGSSASKAPATPPSGPLNAWTDPAVTGNTNCTISAGSTTCTTVGPLRNGYGATCLDASNAPIACSPLLNVKQAGASAYGVLDLSGNLSEPVVFAINTTPAPDNYSIFWGTHGNGSLSKGSTSGTYDGFATNSDWPTFCTQTYSDGTPTPCPTSAAMGFPVGQAGYSGVVRAYSGSDSPSRSEGKFLGGSWMAHYGYSRTYQRVSPDDSTTTTPNPRSGIRLVRTSPQ